MTEHKKVLFVAVEVPPCVLEEAARLQRVLQESHLLHARYPLREHMHITLAFLGPVYENQIPKIKKLLEQINWNSFTVTLNKLDYFVRHEQIRVIYISVQSDELIALGNEIQNVLRTNNLYHETRVFVPHITLARVEKTIAFAQLKEFLQACAIKQCAFNVHHISLVESELLNQKHTHNILFTISTSNT